MRIQNIRFPEPEICSEEALYFHRREEWVDFDGYFNLFYIEKRKTYTDQKTLTLHLELKDCRALRLMHDEEILQELELSGAEETLELPFPYQETDKGVFWFAVKQEAGSVPKVKGWFEGTCSQEKPVRIAAVVSTFKREEYVLRNLKSVLRFLEKPENAALKLCYWLIDNGRSLSEHAEISSLAAKYPDVVRIIPNSNVGGAGGFTRGMMEAIEEKEGLGLTHVQMMDDDAILDPELFVRAYGFLGMRKDRWKDITLGGSLLREDFPYLQQAAGEWFEGFRVQNDFPLADLRDRKVCTAPYMCEAMHEHIPYSGWWCCCMSLDVVRADNLPIPLFLHHDDIEFGLRNQKAGIVFLNGFGVWHKGFELTFPGVNTYYDVRNTLITKALTEPDAGQTEILKWIWKRITADVIEFRYGEMRLAYQAFYDFCRGPQWLYQTDAEKLNSQLRERVKMEPVESLKEKLTEKEYEKIREYIEQYRASYGIHSIQHYLSAERRRSGFLKIATFNGWLLPGSKKLIALSPVESPFEAFRRKRVILFEPFTGKAILAKKDWKELGQAFKLYFDTWKLLKGYHSAVEEYRRDMGKFTCMDAWKKYLRKC